MIPVSNACTKLMVHSDKIIHTLTSTEEFPEEFVQKMALLNQNNAEQDSQTVPVGLNRKRKNKTIRGFNIDEQNFILIGCGFFEIAPRKS